MLLLQKICIKGIIYYMKIREKGLHIMKRIFYGWFVVLACALMLFTSIGMVGNNFSIFMPFIRISPEVTSQNLKSKRIMVDLPMPLAPITPILSFRQHSAPPQPLSKPDGLRSSKSEQL